MKKIIFLCGFCGSGKDYFADKLINNDISQYDMPLTFPYNLNFKECLRLSFAMKLKELFCEKYGLDIKYLEENKKFYRNKIIEFAKEIRKYDDSYFARHILKQIEASNKNIILITDLRFKIEYETIKQKYNDVSIYYIQRIEDGKYQEPSNESDFVFLNEIVYEKQTITYVLNN